MAGFSHAPFRASPRTSSVRCPPIGALPYIEGGRLPPGLTIWSVTATPELLSPASPRYEF